MIVTSRIPGTFVIVEVPGAKIVAAMSFKTLFFAPVTRTVPSSLVPPVTEITVTLPTLANAV
jgi:hypothetical protein